MTVIRLGTKVEDPLVRYSERDFVEGPYRICRHCKTWFTYLGLKNHVRACQSNPDNAPPKKDTKRGAAGRAAANAKRRKAA